MVLAVDNGDLPRNPCRNLGRLLAKVKRQQSEEVDHVNAWSREEVAELLKVASAEEPRFYPLLAFLLHTGCRRSDSLGLKWEDVDFTGSRILIRRALVRGKMGTPKSGRARYVVLSPALAAILSDLFAQRRRECLARGWREVAELVFCSVFSAMNLRRWRSSTSASFRPPKKGTRWRRMLISASWTKESENVGL